MASFAVTAAVSTLVSAGLSAYESHEQGVQASNMAKAKARVETDRAAAEQINMRQNMLKALASQNAGTLGAVGTGGASSFGANARRQITQSQNDLMISKANASAQVSLFDMQAANARSAGDIGAITDLANSNNIKAGQTIYSGGH